MEKAAETHRNSSAVSEIQVGKISSTFAMISVSRKYLGREHVCLGH